jgi:octaprenyl-diphosphate synthase
MELFEKKFKQNMQSKTPLLDRITHYIVKRKGKMMRPMFVFLSAGMCAAITEKTYRAASLIELLHTATLVHDDVVDNSNLRRGFFSINALWKNKIAVLVGDYLLSKGLLLSVTNFELLEIVSEAVKVMSEGELLQIEKARRLDIQEEIYFEIIRQKTASLIAACCACGGQSAGAGIEEIKLLHQFGELTGMAFQIKDDLFDYSSDGIIGKPTGNDIKESKMTLPLIYALTKVDSNDRRFIINVVKNESHDKQKVQQVIKMVHANNGIVYANEKMLAYRDQALELLNHFKESEYKKSLIALVNFTIDRKY